MPSTSPSSSVFTRLCGCLPWCLKLSCTFPSSYRRSFSEMAHKFPLEQVPKQQPATFSSVSSSSSSSVFFSSSSPPHWCHQLLIIATVAQVRRSFFRFLFHIVSSSSCLSFAVATVAQTQEKVTLSFQFAFLNKSFCELTELVLRVAGAHSPRWRRSFSWEVVSPTWRRTFL